MKKINLPDSKDALIIVSTEIEVQRLDLLKKLITQPYEMGFTAYVSFLENSELAGIEPSDFANFEKGDYRFDFAFLIDNQTISDEENTIVCVDLDENSGMSFRVVPSEIWAVENNLTISNMYFEDFKESCGPDNVFRGFE